MRISDLIRAGGSLQDAAYGGTAELTRYRVARRRDPRRRTSVNIDLAAVLRGDPAANIVLAAVRPAQHQGDTAVGRAGKRHPGGEVRFPGRYAIKRGETLSSVIARAGGLTEFAFPEGSVFTREELRAPRAGAARWSGGAPASTTWRSWRCNRWPRAQGNGGGGGSIARRSVVAVAIAQYEGGRPPGDRPAAERCRPRADPMPTSSCAAAISLIVPKFQQEVTVIGEVPNATSHLYQGRPHTR